MFAGLIDINIPGRQIADALANRVTDAIGSIVRSATHAIFDPGLDPDFSATWFKEVYGRSMAIALLVAVLALVFSIVFSAIKGSAAFLLRALVMDAPIAVFGMAFSLAGFTLAVKLSDEIADFIVSGSIRKQIITIILRSATLNGAGSATSLFVVLIIALLTIIGGFGITIIMFIRLLIIYSMGALIPLSFAAYMFPALRSSVRRALEGVIAIVFSKVAIMLCLSVGVSMMAQINGGPGLKDESGDPQLSGFSFLPEGSLIFQGAYRVDYIKFGSLKYTGALKRSTGPFSDAWLNARTTNMADQLNRAYAAGVFRNDTKPADGSLLVDGNNILEYNSQTCKKTLHMCIVGRIGSRVDTDTERLFRVLVPIDASRAELRVVQGAQDFEDERDNDRQVLLDEEFIQRNVYLTEKGQGTETNKKNKKEILPESVDLLNHEQKLRMNKIFGYEFDSATHEPKLAEGALPNEACTRGNRSTWLGFVRQPAYCAVVTADGVVTVGGIRIGVLAEPSQSENYDFAVGFMGGVIWILACFSPIPLLRLFKLFDASFILDPLAEAAKPLNRAAFISFRAGNFRDIGGLLSGKGWGGRKSSTEIGQPEQPDPTGRFRSSGSNSTFSGRSGGGGGRGTGSGSSSGSGRGSSSSGHR